MRAQDPFRSMPSTKYAQCTVIWVWSPSRPSVACTHPIDQVSITLDPWTGQQLLLVLVTPALLTPGMTAECRVCGERGFTAIRLRNRS